ncbi:MAG: hypothetical protein FWF53_11810 [Candidatus Azobacteroides sp.]|nr:hypothetical protein [Candidatus Azobacteroides sp.]
MKTTIPHSELHHRKGKGSVVLFLCVIIHFATYSPVCLSQLQVKIGNDTTFCSGNIEEGIQLASQLVVTGGTAPYQYCWSISEPYEYLPGRFNYASSVLNDTTSANPLFLYPYINDPQEWTRFILTVKDNTGNEAADSIHVRFSEYMVSIPEPVVFSINKGDSVFIDVSDVNYGGILPYTSYSWIPEEGVSDPDSPKAWFKPSEKTHYQCMITDSVGYIGYAGSGYLILIKSETAIQSIVKNNTIYQHNENIFFDNPNNENIKLSFYDLSGKLIHEGATTADRYNPAFIGKGTVFVCIITINNKQETIKYIVP